RRAADGRGALPRPAGGAVGRAGDGAAGAPRHRALRGRIPGGEVGRRTPGRRGVGQRPRERPAAFRVGRTSKGGRAMRTEWLDGAAGLTALGLAAGLLAFRGGAQGAAGPAGGGAAEAASAQLPIGQVVLFSSGVGYFQREGSVEGTARVDLSFPVGDIND